MPGVFLPQFAFSFQVSLITPQRIINLQRDMSMLVTNIQTSADAKESMRRKELEEARRLRLERLENEVKSSQEKFEEITRGWSIAKQKVIPQELQEALNYQQELCAALIENKKKVINELQQELKVADDCYVKDLRKQTEELDLLMERMEDQIKILTKAYREELAQIQRVYQQECEVLLTRDKTEWEQYMKELLDKELERLMQRKKKVEEYEAVIQTLMLENTDKCSLTQAEQSAKFQVMEREHQQMKGTRMIMKLKQKKQEYEAVSSNFNLAHIKRRIFSLQTEWKNLSRKCNSQEKQFTKRNQLLCEDYKRNIQQYEGVQKKIKHFAATDSKRFEEMWLMIEGEVKQLVERALVIDSQIYTELGLSWERPPMPFMGHSGPIRPKKQALPNNQRVMDASVGPKLESAIESRDTEMHKERTAVQSESSAEEGNLLMETVKKVMEMLCDEAGFLMDDQLLNLLAPLGKEEQTLVKLCSLLHSLGIEEEDFPKLVHFLIKYKHQHQREQTEDICVEFGESSDSIEEVGTNSMTSEVLDPDHVMPALKSFLEQLRRSRHTSARQLSSLQRLEARDSSEDKAYWESMGNIISKDKLKLWDATEDRLTQYLSVLTDISELIPECQSLEQQNKDLRRLLQQTLNSRVTTELEVP
uniref:dynein regulatory complex protein 1 n=1 Tax=Scatophagus argus TaxID=75038 RepID=UPI001ED800B2|nr:dynein regulatory complex protein 1 [Scatophagus argus]